MSLLSLKCLLTVFFLCTDFSLHNSVHVERDVDMFALLSNEKESGDVWYRK